MTAAVFHEDSAVRRLRVLQGRKRGWCVSWQRVVVIGLLVGGSVACAALGQVALATLFGGAAAGAVIPGLPMERNGK